MSLLQALIAAYMSGGSGGGGGGEGTRNYNSLLNRPKINGVLLAGDLSTDDLGIVGGEGGETTQAITVSSPIGRYAAGDEISSGTALEEIFRKILTKVSYPTLTNPSVSLGYEIQGGGQLKSLMAVGDVIGEAHAVVLLDRGRISPQYSAESEYRSGEHLCSTLRTEGADNDYTDGRCFTENSVIIVNPLTRSTPGTVKIIAAVEYAAGCQPKDSDGNNYGTPLPAGTVSKTLSVEFILPFYYGASDSAEISDLTGLTRLVEKKGNKTLSFTTNNQYVVVAYDASYGDLVEIKDQNGFDSSDDFSVSSISVGGQAYKVVVAKARTIDSGAQYSFNFTR